jgi:hypothetical protein
MGGSSSSSKTSIENNTLIVNESDISTLNQNLNETAVNTLVSAAQSCSATISQLQNISFENMTVAGDLNLSDISQSQTAAITFSCVQENAVATDIAQQMLQKVMSEIDNSNNQNVMNQLDAEAAAHQTTGVGANLVPGSGSSSSNSNSNITNNTTQITSTHKNLQNIISNKISQNFNSESVAKCISAVSNNQNIDFKNLNVGGNATIKGVNQTQAATSVSTCMQKNTVAQKVLGEVAQELGLSLKETNTNAVTTEAAAASTAVQKSAGLDDLTTAYGGAVSGIIGSTGGALSGVVGSVGGAVSGIIGSVGSLFGSMLIPLLIIGCIALYVAYRMGFLTVIGFPPPSGGDDDDDGDGDDDRPAKKSHHKSKKSSNDDDDD